MIHNKQWICYECGNEIWIEADHSAGSCSKCGRQMIEGCGEEYDQEFVDNEKYQRAQEEFEDKWGRRPR